jgi:uncharacterized membrane protein (DUF2068 family)
VYDYWLLSLVGVILAVTQVVFGFGAWTLNPWAWTLGVVIQVISLCLALLYIFLGVDLFNQTVTILIAAVILLYLFTTEVKRAFGKTFGSMQPGRRPLGVTILAVLAIIFGTLGIVNWLSMLAGRPFSGAGGAALLGDVYYWTVSVVMSVLQVAFGYGAWTLKPWGWILGVALQAISIAFALLFVILIPSFATFVVQMFSIAIAAIIVFYLFTPDVRRAFGKA